MNDRLKNGALAGLLVLTLVLVGFSLRSPGAESTRSAARASAANPSTPAVPPTPTPSARRGPVVFLGDSVAEGTSASAPEKRWTALVARQLELPEVNLGHARTGYLRRGPEGSCGAAACPNFVDSVEQVLEARPSTVIVTGGGNDTGLPAAEVSRAVSSTLTSLRRGLPDATIYVVNPWWDLREVPDSLEPLSATVKAATAKVRAVHLDTGQPLVGRPDLMVESGTNPDDDGHAALARAVTDAIAKTSNG